jgi:hypothetical protein
VSRIGGLCFDNTGRIRTGLVLHKEVKSDTGNQDHEDNNDPIDRMPNDLKIDNLIH